MGNALAAELNHEKDSVAFMKKNILGLKSLIPGKGIVGSEGAHSF